MGIFLGTLGDDYIKGTSSGDIITALTGNDTIVGNGGADIIDGGLGDDVIYAGSKTAWSDGALDVILAGAGDDRVYAGFGDAADGGLGFDFLSLDLSNSGSGIHVDFRPDILLDLAGLATVKIGGKELAGFEAIDTLIGSDFSDRITVGNPNRLGSHVDAGDGNDRIRTGRGADVLHGDDGADRLFGKGGNDTLGGGDGNDVLHGGFGRDILTGGEGRDRFVFNDQETSASRGRADVITDFSHSDHDRIVLSAIDAVTGGTDHDDAFTFIGGHRFSGTAGELRVAHVGADTFVSGDTDGDGHADFSIHLQGTVDLVANDFVL